MRQGTQDRDVMNDSDAPIQNPDRIDIVGLCQSGGLDLVIVVGAPLDGSDDTLHLLAQKVRNYLTEIAAGELLERYPEAIPGPFRILILCKHAIDAAALGLINALEAEAATQNVALELETTDS
jgi:hypothetical protein